MTKVTVITATTGNPKLAKCIQSVVNQKGNDLVVDHLLFVDGPERIIDVSQQIFKLPMNKRRCIRRCDLPYPVGTDRWNGHRMYAAGSFLADGEYVMFLDDDNWLEPDHIQNCLDTIAEMTDVPMAWTYSLRNIVDKDDTFLCQDNCESLGDYPSILGPNDYFIDVNCFFLPRILAVQIAPLWFRKFREPGQPEIDRVLSHVLRKVSHKGTNKYTVNYTVGNTQNSVQKEFFEKGNAAMLEMYEGELPWKKQ